jgi:GDP-L-fucose synthase
MFYKNKKVLVTGGTGFVGTNIVEALLNEKAKIVVPLHKRKPIVKSKCITFIKADLTKQSDCLKVCRGVDYVFHAAGEVSAAAATVNNPMPPIVANLILTAQMLQAAWSSNVARILIFSSSTGYPLAKHPLKEEEMWGKEPPAVYFGYGWMRRYFEKLAAFVHSRSNTKIALVRPTAVYGRYDDFNPKTSHVIPALIRRALAKENPFVVWGTGKEVRDFLHISDLAKGCLLALEKYAVCDPVNIGCGRSITVKEIVTVILQAAGYTGATIQFDASKPATVPYRVIDTSKGKRFLGFTPAVKLEDGLRDTVDWYKKTSL